MSPDPVSPAGRRLRLAPRGIHPPLRPRDEGVLTTRVAETFALDEAAKAHARLDEGGVRGRLVLTP